MNDRERQHPSTIPADVYLMINHQIFPLENPVTSIGRKLENDLVIQDMLVSREHARISYEKQKFMLEDLGSTGGTFVNGKRVEKSVLNQGDVINIANVALTFVNGRDEVSADADRRTEALPRS
ncbi:MAG: FHA domain-containing protein [Anaerolineae bacterium]|nr:FHA domain-containing protein [Anaerolineae bacterium]